MHHYALVLIPADGDVDRLVAEAMAPFDERLDVEEAVAEDDGSTYRHPRGLWDWYQIGGRYTGVLSGYDPYRDPALLVTCPHCGGTGRREDELGRAARAADPEYTCNGCSGSGEQRRWPTDWPRHDGDVVDAAAVIVRLAELFPDGRLPYSIFTHGSDSAIVCEAWNGREVVQLLDADGIRAALSTVLHTRLRAGFRDRVVVVDHHS